MGPAVYRAKRAGLHRRVWGWLARTEVVVALFLAVLVLVALGSCFPQIPSEIATQSDQLAQWEALARARFGDTVASALETAGVFSLYRSPGLWALAVLLATATLACTIQGWRGNWRAAFRQPPLIPEPFLEAAPLKAVVQPAYDALARESVSDQFAGSGVLLALARAQLQQSGFWVRCNTSGSEACCRGDRNRLSSLGTLLEHVAALFLFTGVLLTSVAAWRETLTLAPGQTEEVGRGTGLALRNDAFQIDRYRDGSPAAYTARVTVMAGKEPIQHEVGVNHPVAQNGVRVYLQAYREEEQGYDVTLLVVRDPGYLPVVAAGLLFLGGLIVTLYFPHSTVHIRVTPDGSLHIAGWADHRAYDFEHEFTKLVAHLSQAWDDRHGEPPRTDQSAGLTDFGQ